MSTLTSVSGSPRIGQNRELKKIIEGYWKGAIDLAIVKATANWQDADLLARLSENLGEAMVGINEDEIETIMAARGE